MNGTLTYSQTLFLFEPIKLLKHTATHTKISIKLVKIFKEPHSMHVNSILIGSGIKNKLLQCILTAVKFVNEQHINR